MFKASRDFIVLSLDGSRMRQTSDLLLEHGTYAEVYATFLLSTGAPSNSLQDDVRRLEEQHQTRSDDESDSDEVIIVT